MLSSHPSRVFRMLPQPTNTSSIPLVPPYRPAYSKPVTVPFPNRRYRPGVHVLPNTSYAYTMPLAPSIVRPPQRHASSIQPLPQRIAHHPHAARSQHNQAAKHCSQAARSENIKLYAILALFLIWVLAWIVFVVVYVQGGL